MKLQIVSTLSVLGVAFAAPKRYAVPGSAQAAAAENVEIPTSITSADDVVELLTALQQKHGAKLQELVNDKSTRYQKVLTKLEKQIAKADTQQKKIHNTKLVLINNADVFGMTKPEMIQFIKDNKGEVESLIEDINVSNINQILNGKLKDHVANVQGQITAALDGIENEDVKAVVSDLQNVAKNFMKENGGELEALLEQNGDSSLEQVGSELASQGWAWLVENYNLDAKLDQLKQDAANLQN